jgi:hypothetical protein
VVVFMPSRYRDLYISEEWKTQAAVCSTRDVYMRYALPVYFNMSVIQNLQCRVVGRLINDKLKRVWKQAVVA